MAGSGSLVLRPWIRELILGSELLSSPRAGQLLKVLQDAEAPGPSRAPNVSDVETTLLVSDGTHSVRCLVTREALDTSDWEEKEFGFRGAEGRLLLLRNCRVCIQVSEGGMVSSKAALDGLLPVLSFTTPETTPELLQPAEFYLQVNRFSLLPTEQPRVWVMDCHQDSDVQKKLYDCLEDHLSECTSSNTGLSLSQLLDEVQEDQEHRGALVRLAESCLVLAGPCAAPSLTRWAASRCRALEETVYTVPSLLLHIPENEQQVLSSLGPGQRPQGTPVLPNHVPSHKGDTSTSLQPALPSATPDPVQEDNSQPLPAHCSAASPTLLPSSPPSSQAGSCSLLTCTPSLSPLSHVPLQHQAPVTRAQKPSLEFRELGLSTKNQQPSPRSRSTKGTQESCPVWAPPTRHRDGSAFQYKYQPPCSSLCAQVQATRLPPQLMAWALHFLTEPQLESEVTQV
ncbi:adrenocortical dysplasia protein homolog isoform X2 [Lepus europaeus]|uniref:adrenocortical dysplasia protein homolog isoform X2 n=1 Tax=Lepus europaeus TaxID=9983 RepID=UPI002B458CFD|nr:adrenocortical dysplasia protein homolog isoform X2 [Lepus europaeus]